jgi:hypothetical protein
MAREKRQRHEVLWTGMTQDPGGVRDGAADIGTVRTACAPSHLMAQGIGDLPRASWDPWIGMRAIYGLMTTNQQMIGAGGHPAGQ